MQASLFPSRHPLNTLEGEEFSALVAGIDEVGRGALFGPVVAAAVLVRRCQVFALSAVDVTDSKKLSPKQRNQLVSAIHNTALDCQIGVASVDEIDRLNILQASLLAMKRALLKLTYTPNYCLVDGNQAIPSLTIPQQTIVQGDKHSAAIAAASILAKVWRDQLIIRLDTQYPGYDLAANKGYGTKKHQLALQTYGPSPLHRTSFKPCQIDPLKKQHLKKI